jgi:hypothetical protein
MPTNNRKQNNAPLLEAVDFAELFSTLRKHPDKQQSKNVECILDLLSRLGDKGAAARVVTELRKALKDYRWGIQVTPTLQGFRTVLFAADRGTLLKDDEWEYRTVGFLLSLLHDDPKALSRLRRCADAECKKWLYVSGRQRFCDRNCKQHHFETDPAKHAEKLARMKRLYDAEQEQKKNPKSGVGLRQRERFAR